MFAMTGSLRILHAAEAESAGTGPSVAGLEAAATAAVPGLKGPGHRTEAVPEFSCEPGADRGDSPTELVVTHVNGTAG